MEQMRSLPQIDECPTPDLSLIMNIIMWNCRGALNPNFRRSISELINCHSPSMLIVTETRVGGARAKEITDTLPFYGAIHADTIGYAGGIWLLWNSELVDVSVLAATEQEIHAVVKVLSSNFSWLLSSIYASPRFLERKLLWNNLSQVATLHNLPWLLVGDFNEVLSSDDKFGGLPVRLGRSQLFNNCLNDCGMIDLGFHGPRFTWSNLREVRYLIQERLDRGFANTAWREAYPEASVHHLTRTHSDHCPVLVCLDKPPSLRLPRPFIFQPVWLSHPTFNVVVTDSWDIVLPLESNVIGFTEAVMKWNRDVFGNIFWKKKNLMARLRGIQSSLATNPNAFLVNLEKTLRFEYLTVLQQEEDFWSVKSRYNWLIQGDRNTAFFHASTLVRRKRNRIFSIQDNMGNWIHLESEIAALVRHGFMELFCTSMTSAPRSVWSVNNWKACISVDDSLALSNPISLEEVKAALWTMKPFKAPGPDGLHAGFFQHTWPIVGVNVIKEVQDIFRSGVMPSFLNQTLITLIPKCVGADCLNKFRPIGLCNTIYKVVTKIIVLRLRPLLNHLISPLQTAFVPGRKGLDNMIIVQELVHSLSLKKGKVGFMAIKIDLEKAYDRLEWHFIRDMLIFFKIPDYIAQVIMSCVSTSSISVLLNGGKLDPFLPSRGIRQGDPLSPYLFIMCMEFLSFLIHERCEEQLWDPIKAARNGPAFSHLFFADDLVLFAKADRKNCQSVKEVLESFCDLSGQKVNLNKSKVFFSPNVSPILRSEFCAVLGFESTPNLGKYLGFPIKHIGSSSQDYDFVVERVQSKLTGWKANLLSMQGRVILAQSVTSAIPSYVMQGGLLPGKTLAALDRLTRNFIWGSSATKKKLHLVSWKKIAKPKADGGLGIMAAKPKNLALAAKLCWRFKSNPHETWVKVLKGKYLAGSKPRKHAVSKIWTTILNGENICNKGTRWSIGNNCSLNFWTDRWLTLGTLRSLIHGPLNYGEENLCINNIFEGGSWYFHILSFIFPQHLELSIKAVPIRRDSIGEDSLIWNSSTNGDFDSKDAYLLALGNINSNLGFVDQWIWNLNIPPKIQYFLWKCAHHSLPVKTTLVQRRIIEAPICDICLNSDETILHVLRDCRVAHQFWLDSGLAPSNPFFLGDIDMDWLRSNACNTSKIPGKCFTWNYFFLFGIWQLWIQRNKSIFQVSNPNPLLFSVVENLVLEFFYCVLQPPVCRSKVVKHVRWEKPNQNFFKLNTDGSASINSGFAGGGGLIRNSAGDWIMGFMRNIGCTGSAAAELWALRDGLSLCVQLQLHAVEIELDAQVIIFYLSESSTYTGNLSPLIDDCRELLRRLPQTKVGHCFREANFCADALAKMGTTSMEDFVVFSFPPLLYCPYWIRIVWGCFVIDIVM
jgi:ribonuclease HI